VNVAAVTDSGYKLLLKNHNSPVKKNEKPCVKSWTVRNFWKIQTSFEGTWL